MAEQVKVRGLHHVGRGLVWMVMLLLVGALLLLWSWNTVVFGVFGLPSLQLKHALALEVLLGFLSFPFIAVRFWITVADLRRKGALS